jgi:RNA polymerase sigma factor (sigma-70 family)
MGHDATEYSAVPASPTATETGRLVEQARNGDPHAFDSLVRRFQDMAVGYSAAILGDFHLAEDTAQEAFLETYRVLPALRVPDAFPAYLRLTLRKHCDRVTRRKRIPTLPLDAAQNATRSESLPDAVAVRERRDAVRDAVRGLPESERVTVVLFYIGQRSLKEVAEFLDVPVSTVKNRLHTARRRLRERMIPLMEETLREQRPSNNDRFHGKVIARLYTQYREQFRENAQTADRSLLEKAREEPRQAIAEGIPDAETAHFGILLLMWTNDFAKFPELMDRYLAQPLPRAEEFWAKFTRVRGLAAGGKADATVQGQRELMTWIKGNIPGDPPVRLSAQDPFIPTDDPEAEILSPDTLPVFALSIAEIGTCFHDAGVFDEWLTMGKETVTAAPKTASNRLWRFYHLRHAAHLLAQYGRQEEALLRLEDIRALADEEDDWQSPRWPIEALLLNLRMRADAKDVAGGHAVATEAIGLLEAYRSRSDRETSERALVMSILTTNLAAFLTMGRYYDLALPLWELSAQDWLPTVWSYFWYAECVWNLTKDRERTLALLREAAARRYDNYLRESFIEADGFADVREDAEFLAALTPG